MDVEDYRPVELPTNDSDLLRLVSVVVLIPTVLGVIHHVDHIIRGNHVGWTITPHVNALTHSPATSNVILWYRSTSGAKVRE